MSEYQERGYLFLQSFNLEEPEIRKHLNEKIRIIEDKENINLKPYKLYINVVKNRSDDHLGYSYIWTDKIEIYNLFCSLNLDGSERIREYEDPNWEAPEKIDLNQCDDWSLLAEEHENQTCPVIKELLPPLIDIEYYTPGDYQTRIGPMKLGKIGKNTIYSKNIEPWINEKILRYHIGFFEKDKSKYNNKGRQYYYPLINIRNNTVNIVFSPKNPYTASFLINVIKKINIKYNNKEKLIFFSQSKN